MMMGNSIARISGLQGIVPPAFNRRDASVSLGAERTASFQGINLFDFLNFKLCVFRYTVSYQKCTLGKLALKYEPN